jgi:hypothetical protein
MSTKILKIVSENTFLNAVDEGGKIWATTNPSLTDVPKLPEIEEKDNLDILKEHCKTLIDGNQNLKEGWAQPFCTGVNAVFGRINSLKAASKKKYTEEDIEKVLAMKNIGYGKDYILKALNPIPKEVELETWVNDNNPKQDWGIEEPKVENGFVKVVKWIYE